MPWVFLALMSVYGISCLLFAFVQPPEALRSMFKVPAIFVFLPDRWVMPVGRVVLGLGSLALVAFIAIKVLGVPH
jgi:hypothetical protein